MGKPITVAIVGCGNRGKLYGTYALEHPDKMKVTAVAEPNEYRRNTTADLFNVPVGNRFESYIDFINSGYKVDAVINGTMDRLHYDTSMKILNAGFDMLLEKPISLNKKEMMEIYNLSLEKGKKVMVCHVLRYATFYLEIKKRLLAGAVGKVHSIVTEENVHFHHFASAFVRGRWGNSDESGSRILMAKCCHDLDIITWLKSESIPRYVSSMGNLFNYKKENAPEGSGEKCTVNCEVANDCEYDAKKLYVDKGLWKVYGNDHLDKYKDRDSEERLLQSFGEDNPYGRCVWRSDNNVNDHQTVIIEFEDGCTANHNLIGGTAKPDRTIHIVGTKGEIYGSLESGSFVIRKPDLDSDNPGMYSEEKVEVDVQGEGHGGGDLKLVEDFIEYLNDGETSVSTTDIGDSIYGHLIGFNAQEALEERKVVEIERL